MTASKRLESSQKNPWRVRLRQGWGPVAHDDQLTVVGICTQGEEDDSRTCSSRHAEVAEEQRLDTSDPSTHNGS